MQALNGTMPRPALESVSRKQLGKMIVQVGDWSRVQVPSCYTRPKAHFACNAPPLQALLPCVAMPHQVNTLAEPAGWPIAQDTVGHVAWFDSNEHLQRLCA